MIDIHQNMPISLILTPFDYFQIRPSFAVNPNLILEPCHKQFSAVLDTVMFLPNTYKSQHDHSSTSAEKETFVLLLKIRKVEEEKMVCSLFERSTEIHLGEQR